MKVSYSTNTIPGKRVLITQISHPHPKLPPLKDAKSGAVYYITCKHRSIATKPPRSTILQHFRWMGPPCAPYSTQISTSSGTVLPLIVAYSRQTTSKTPNRPSGGASHRSNPPITVHVRQTVEQASHQTHLSHPVGPANSHGVTAEKSSQSRVNSVTHVAYRRPHVGSE